MPRDFPDTDDRCLTCGGAVRDGICPACSPRARRRPTGIRRLLTRRGILILLAVGIVGAVVVFSAWRILRVDDATRFRREWEWAATLLRDGDHDGADILLRRLRDQQPKNSRLAEQIAECGILRGRDGDAEAILTELLERSPHRPRANALLAHIRLGGEDWASARTLARVAMENGADDFLTRHAAGVAAYRLGLREEAARELRRALEHSPDDVHTRTLLATLTAGTSSARRGRRGDVTWLHRQYVEGKLTGERYVTLLIGLGRTGEALRIARKAVAESPGERSHAVILLGLLGPEDEAEASALFESFAEPSPELRRVRASHLASQGRIDDALAAIGADDSRDGVLARARLLRRAQRPEEALEEVARREDDAQARLIRIHALVDLDRDADAANELAAVRLRWPERPDILLAGADALLLSLERARVADPAGAARVEDLVVASGEKEAGFVACLIRVALIRDDVETARELAARLSDVDDRPIVHRSRILLALRERRRHEAIALGLTARQPVRPDLLWTLAAEAGRSGRPADALVLADRISGPVWTANLRKIRARALFDLSRLEEALTLLTGAEDPDLIVLRARVLRGLKRPVEAAAALGEAPPSPRARALLAFWRIRDGKTAEAGELVFEASDSRTLLALIPLLDGVGASREAARWLDRAFRKWPENAEILMRRALLEIRSAPLSPRASVIRKEVEAAAETMELPGLDLLQGYFALADGDLDTASTTARAVIASEPGRAEAHLLSAYVGLRRGKGEQIRHHLEAVVALKTGRRIALGLLAYLDVVAANRLVTERNLRGADAALARASGRVTKEHRWQLATARLSIARGDYAAGREALGKIGLDEAAALLTLAEQLEDRLDEGDLAGALNAARRLTERRPESPLAWLRRGRLARMTGHPEDGLAFLEKAYRLAPDWDATLPAFCGALVEEGQARRAAAVARAHTVNWPEDAGALALLGEIQLILGDADGAAELAERALAADRSDHRARELEIRVLCRREGAPAAARVARKWAAEDDRDARALALAGRASHLAGDVKEARRYLRRAVAVEPALLSAQVGLAELLLVEDGAAAAFPFAIRAVEIAPDDVASRVLLGGIEEVMGRLAEARETYECALRIAPRHPLALMTLARLLADANQVERALELSATALEVSPAMPEAKYARGYVLFRADRAKEAVPLLRAAVGESSLPESRAILGFALQDAGRGDEALAIYEGLREQVSGPLAKEIALRLELLR